MAKSCLLYYITDRMAFPGDEPSRRRRLLEKIGEAAHAGVDFIQLREKDLPAHDLELLAREAVSLIHQARTHAPRSSALRPAFLVNSRTDVALAVQADGVHLRANDISPQEVRQIWREFGAGGLAGQKPTREPLIAVSCHAQAEVAQAGANGATFAVFAPVFEKKDAPGGRPAGLAMLQQASRARIPVLALGGITLSNARSCLAAGAAGIAAIRLFQENDIAEVVRTLRG